MGHRMQTFGNFIDKFPPEQDSLELTFTPTSVPLKKNVGEIIAYLLILLQIILLLFYLWMIAK